MAVFAHRDDASLQSDGILGLSTAFSAFRTSAGKLLKSDYPMGRLGLDPAAYAAAASAALAMPDAVSEPDARSFFGSNFVVLSIAPEPGAPRSNGFVTGYYEPEVKASAQRTDRFTHRLYAKPDDLEKLDAVNRPPGMDETFQYARRMPSGLLEEYPDRGRIDRGFLEGRGLEIAWLQSAADAFFIHIQGSARLRMIDGRVKRVGYAAKTGHPFTAIGRVLVDSGELTLAEADMAGIRAWLDHHPERAQWLFDQNRSFIFFADRDVIDEKVGPVGAADVPLIPLASIAVDRERATFGVPYLIEAAGLEIDGSAYRRIAIAQDTGSAIIGNARADIFVGSGQAAGEIAGTIRHAADFSVLVPKELAERLIR